MPDLFQPGPERARTPSVQPETQRDQRPDALEGLTPAQTKGLEQAREGGLRMLYGNGWEAAGARLDAAYGAEGPAAYQRLEREPGAYGVVTGDPRRFEMAAGGLYARERVVAEARGETPAETYHTDEDRSNRDVAHAEGENLDIDHPLVLRPGEYGESRNTRTLRVPVGGLPATSVRPAYTPLSVTVGTTFTNENVVRVGSRGGQEAQIEFSAHSEYSTNGYGRIASICEGGQIVEVTPNGYGMRIPFRLTPIEGHSFYGRGEGGSDLLGRASVSVPVGKTYRIEFNVTTGLLDRGKLLDIEVYKSIDFTPQGSRSRR